MCEVRRNVVKTGGAAAAKLRARRFIVSGDSDADSGFFDATQRRPLAERWEIRRYSLADVRKVGFSSA